MTLKLSEYSLRATITVPVRVVSVNRLRGSVTVESLGGTRTLRPGDTLLVAATASQNHGEVA